MEIDRRSLLAAIGASAAIFPAISRATTLRPAPVEVLGPFYPRLRPRDQDFDLTRLAGHSERAIGQVIELSGRVLFPDGSPASGALLDIWQSNAAGRYTSPHDNNPAPLDPNFQGSAKLRAGPDGTYRIVTIKPGMYPVDGIHIRAPHIHFDIAARNTRLVTQMYFPGDPDNDRDMLRPRMAGIGSDPELLTCHALDLRADGVARFSWDIVILKS